MSKLRSHMVDFECLVGALYSNRPVFARDVATLASGSAEAIKEVDDFKEHLPWFSAHSLFQRLAKRFLEDKDWYVICVPPGLPFAHGVGAGVIVADAVTKEPAVAGQWTTFIVDREGRRPSSVKMKISTYAEPALWRTCVELRAQIIHSLALDQEKRDEQMKDLQLAEENLVCANPTFLRDLSLKISMPSQSDVYARMLFGALWDLLWMIYMQPADSVASGAWRFPDEAPQLLRAKAVLVEDIARALFLPALTAPETLNFHALQWLARSNPSNRERLLTLLDIVMKSHSLWFQEATGVLVYALRRAGVLSGEWMAEILIRKILGDVNVRVSDRILRRTSFYLTSVGRFDWSVRLAAQARCLA